MPWQCRLHDTQPENPQPGDMWYAPAWLRPAARDSLSPEYFRDWADKRPPLVVYLPSGRPFCVDRKASDGTWWAVAGEPPNITVNPSINHVGAYHGYLRNGVLSDDVDGRRF